MISLRVVKDCTNSRAQAYVRRSPYGLQKLRGAAIGTSLTDTILYYARAYFQPFLDAHQSERTIGFTLYNVICSSMFSYLVGKHWVWSISVLLCRWDR